MSSLILSLLLIPLFLLIFLFFLTRPRPVRLPITNRHVFITGGSSGIGLALAQAAAAAGAQVSILARNKVKLAEVRSAILRATGADITTYSADVRDVEAVRRAIKKAAPIDVLVCNHGVFLPGELAEQSVEEIQMMMDVNVMGTFHLVKAALPGMKAKAGAGKPRSIAIMSSQAGQVGIYGYTAYCASKFALRGMAEALQQEVIGDNIRVSLIFPPDIDTPGLEEELKRRPEAANIIANTSSRMKAHEVAKKTLDGISSGKFVVPCNFEGFMISLVTAGLSPQPSYLIACAEVMGASLMRLVGLCILWSWYGTIHKFHVKLIHKSK